MEGDVIVTQDLMRYELEGEDANGRIIGRHKSTGIGKARISGIAPATTRAPRQAPSTRWKKVEMSVSRKCAARSFRPEMCREQRAGAETLPQWGKEP